MRLLGVHKIGAVLSPSLKVVNFQWAGLLDPKILSLSWTSSARSYKCKFCDTSLIVSRLNPTRPAQQSTVGQEMPVKIANGSGLLTVDKD